MKKISFLGDITCDRPLLYASEVSTGSYNFDEVFINIHDLLKDSDYVIGNLETVFAGEKCGYNSEYMLLNTPDKLAESMRKYGIDAVTTANNHCMDQGIKGIKRTLEILDNNNLEHTGTYKNKKDFENILIKDFDGIKVAFVAGTYSTNETNVDIVLDETNAYYVDLMKDQKIFFGNDIKSQAKRLLINILGPKTMRKLRRKIARKKLNKKEVFFKPYYDSIKENDFSNKYFDQWIKKIENAKKYSDLVIVCPHFGGQFNELPGEYSEKLIDILLKKQVYVVGNHPHVIQKIVKNSSGYLAAFSLGSFNQSMSADYINKDILAEYSIFLHFYINNDKKVKTTYSILKNIQKSDGGLTVYDTYDLFTIINDKQKDKLKSDIIKIISRINGKELKDISIKKEYRI